VGRREINPMARAISKANLGGYLRLGIEKTNAKLIANKMLS
jgi:hypothetical protein